MLPCVTGARAMNPTTDPLREPLAPRTLLRTDALWVIDKPEGLAVEAPERDEDLVRCVRGALPPGAYVGAVQRLERDATGVCVLTLDRRANGAIAGPLERRALPREVVAAVRSPHARGLPAGAVVRAKGPGGVLVSFDPRDEKLADLRARLEPALLGPLHLASMRLPDGTLVRADIPWSLRDAVLRGDALDSTHLVSRLRASLWRRAAVLAEPDTDVCRLAHEGGDDVPGLAVDRYGDFGVVHVYADLDPARRGAVFAAIGEAYGLRGLYAKFRPRQANTLVDTRRDEVAPAAPVWGEGHPASPWSVRERGVRYVARLGDGLSTGIFLDQRDNRAWVRAQSAGRAALNLFAYTGAFSVAAAAGGASRSLSVDASRGAIAWLREHLEANREGPFAMDPRAHEGVCAEVFGWLEGARARGDRYGLLVCDPPSYSSTRDGPRWSSERDWPALAEATLRVGAPGARALFCSNHRGISPARFEAMLREGARRAGVTVREAVSVSAPADHPPPRGEPAHLKTVRMTLG
jgi:23S rRNA G2069 N7-methylase RlmK/C1962 C5-methylase RlmI